VNEDGSPPNAMACPVVVVCVVQFDVTGSAS
jgi:hypothetical protein